jgi:hypothetical protein
MIGFWILCLTNRTKIKNLPAQSRPKSAGRYKPKEINKVKPLSVEILLASYEIYELINLKLLILLYLLVRMRHPWFATAVLHGTVHM